MINTGIEILDKYVRFFTGDLRRRGIEFDNDDLAGDLAESYAMCLRNYNLANDEGVSFNTYVVTAFKNRVKLFIRNLAKERYESIPLLNHEREYTDIPDISGNAMDKLMVDDMKREIFTRIKSGRTLIVFNELVNTSKRVEEVMNLLAAHYNDLPATMHGVKGSGVFRKAVELVYGFKAENVRYHLEQVKMIAKTALTS